MRISSKTLYNRICAVEDYFDDKTKAELLRASESMYGKMYDLTIEQFTAITEERYAEVLGDISRPTVLQVYWLKRFKEFVAEFTNALKNLQPPKDADEAIASANLPKISPAESMLIFARNYFGLHSFDEASRVTLAEFLIAKRDVYITALYHQRLARAKKNKKK